MLIKINRQACLSQYPVFPLSQDNYPDESIFFYPPVFKGYCYTLDSKTFKGHVKLLAKAFKLLAIELGYDKLIFLGDSTTAWLYQQNDYKPVQAAQLYLTENKVGKRFNGALEVQASELPTFITHLAWLSRCNAALPYIYFTNEAQSVIGHICQYGNLHLSILNKKVHKRWKEATDKSGFIDITGERCGNYFGKTSAITGMRSVL